jgi:DNA primase
MAYLERNPDIGYISLCLDNDDAGREAAAKIFDALGSDERYSDIAVTIDWPEGAKDYNDTLLRAVSIEKEQKPSNRQKADIFI